MPADLKHILVADDDADTRTMLGHYLAHWGFTALPARDGNEAAAILGADDAPAIALIDWMMPGMEGTEVCRFLRRQPERPYTYLILLTGKANKEEIATGLDAGADDYITKPCDMTELRARVLAMAEDIQKRRAAVHQPVAVNPPAWKCRPCGMHGHCRQARA